MKPSFSSPATTRSTPVATIMPAARVAGSDGLVVASPDTAEKTSTAEAEVPATTSCRLVPKIAYKPSVASRVYRPA